MNKDKPILTIITDTRSGKELLKNFVHEIKQYIKEIIKIFNKNTKINHRQKYGGHYAVTRSIITGLQKIGYSYNYNPLSLTETSDTVYVPGGRLTLEYMIKLRKENKIKKLIAGPNIVVTPFELLKIKDHNYIDLYLQPSNWVINWWENMRVDFPFKILTWYAGVDTEKWKPDATIFKNRKNILLYKKHVPEDIFLLFKNFLDNNDYVTNIIEYGLYTQEEYLSALQINCCVVYFTESESQGISLAEAWATNTPTIVWESSYFTYKGIECKDCSSAPYLTNSTGQFFKNIDEFKEIFSNWNPEEYSPRDWVIKNMTDEVTTKNLIEIIKNN